MSKRLMVGLAALSLAAAGMVVGLSALSASASTGDNVSGTFLETGPITVLPHGSPHVGSDSHPILFFGGFAGTSISTEHTVLRPDLSFETTNTIDFTGTVTTNDGTVLGTGTLRINFTATGTFVPDPGRFFAHFEIVSSGGGLTGLRGNGTVVGVPGVPGGNGTVTGTVHF